MRFAAAGNPGRSKKIAWVVRSVSLVIVFAAHMAFAWTKEYGLDLTGETSPHTIDQAVSLVLAGSAEDGGTDVRAYGVYSPDEVDITNAFDIDVEGTGGIPADGPVADS